MSPQDSPYWISHFRWIVALGVPTAATALGILAKRIVRREPFNQAHAFLGVELVLSAFSAALLNIGEIYWALFKATGSVDASLPRLMLNTGLSVIAIVFLMLIIAILQDFEAAQAMDEPTVTLNFFVGAADLGGFLLLAAAAYLVPLT